MLRFIVWSFFRSGFYQALEEILGVTSATIVVKGVRPLLANSIGIARFPLPIKLLKHFLREPFNSEEVGQQLGMEANNVRLLFEGMCHLRYECSQRLLLSFQTFILRKISPHINGLSLMDFKLAVNRL